MPSLLRIFKFEERSGGRPSENNFSYYRVDSIENSPEIVSNSIRIANKWEANLAQQEIERAHDYQLDSLCDIFYYYRGGSLLRPVRGTPRALN
jgi:hypothetical protein